MQTSVFKKSLAVTVVAAVLAIHFLSVVSRPADGDVKPADLYVPADGFVPDDSTAIRVAEAVWLPIYGESIYDFVPFVATLRGDSVWVVEGTLPKEFLLGGTPYAEIRKADCAIIGVTHFE